MPDLFLLLVDDIKGAALGVDRLGAELDESTKVRLTVSLHGQVSKLHEDERDLVVQHVDQWNPATAAAPTLICGAGAALGFVSAPMRLIW